MEKFFPQNALFFLVFLTSSTIGSCFLAVEEEVQKNRGMLMTPVIHENLSSWQHESTQAVTKYLAVHGWSPINGATEYYGLEATMDVYGFNLQHGQETAGFIWIYNVDETHAANIILAGWNVDPYSYNDSQTHFTTDWLGQPSKGCLDMRCPGFQRTGGSHPVVPGHVIYPVSSTSSRKHYITVRVSKDQNSGDWEIYYGFDGEAKIIGYYPRSLFTSLSYKPVNIMFGGFAYREERKPSPPMGSGIAPPKNAASFSNLKFFDAAGNAHPIDYDLSYVSNCYPVTSVKDGMFFYGGPGNVC